MRKINENNTISNKSNNDAKLANIKLTDIHISKAQKAFEKELDMLAWGFSEAEKNLPPITEPVKQVKRGAPGRGQRVFERSELPRNTWRDMLRNRISEIKEDLQYIRDIAESKREMRRDERELKRMEKTDKHDMTKLRLINFLTGN